eukprot:7659066-Pyramimonas_sp.AAC.1
MLWGTSTRPGVKAASAALMSAALSARQGPYPRFSVLNIADPGSWMRNAPIAALTLRAPLRSDNVADALAMKGPGQWL